MRILLIDGTYELFRAFYGSPGHKNAAGEEVGASRTLLRSLYNFLIAFEATHVACAFDHVIESFRNDLFGGYKTGEGIDPDLYAQFDLAEQVTEALGIATWPMIEFEADDALASAAHALQADPKVNQVVLCSPDKDLMQCVRGERVVGYDRLRQRWFSELAVREKFGVPPSSIPDFLALVGDSADGIPGVPRWGEKSAGGVLGYYENIEAIPSKASEWAVKVRGAPALSASLEAHRKEALLYRRLATLRLDVPLRFDPDALVWHGVNRAAVSALCQRFDDVGFLEKVTRFSS